MLSNIELTLLSLINEKPSYAYEIDKQIEAREMRRWVKIGVASVYQVLERLEKKGMLLAKKEQEGKMPERRRYYMTEQGQQELARGAVNLLSRIDWYYLDLNVGLECCDALPPEEVAICLGKRLREVKANLIRVTRRYQSSANSVNGCKKEQFILENLILFRKAELQFLENVLESQGVLNEVSKKIRSKK